ncbi:MAG TPA: class I adenylate-forming enzyme family protein [Stellaceae bacterium]
MNLASIFLNHATARPRSIAIIEEPAHLDYETAARFTAGFAAHLARQGVGPRDRIGLCLKDSADHLLLHFATIWLGATIVPIDHRWTLHEKIAVARAFDCRFVIVEPDAAPIGDIPSLALDPRWRGERGAPPPTDDERLAMMLSLSSGTTGRPSGALVSHRELYERWIGQWVGIGFNGGDRYLAATPLYFGAGRSFAMSFLAAGGTVIFRPPPAQPLDLIEAARRYHASIMFLVPTQIRGLLDAWQGASPALPTVRRLVTSGAAIAAAERRRVIERLTPGLVDYYGTSEGGGISVLMPEEQLTFAETVGRPAFRTDIEIVDDAMNPVPPGTVGRLRYRGPGVSRALVSADGVATSGENGWYYPGDLARLLPSGHVQLAGRAKDLIIRGGVNIYPAEIEAVLGTHAAVGEVCVFGIADARLGEIVAAAVVRRRGTDPTEADIQAHGRERLVSYKVPDRIIFVAELPRNSSGKVLRAELGKLR